MTKTFNGLRNNFLNTRPNEYGGGLFIILVAVVLFAALTYAISQGGSGARSLTQEKIRLYASEIIDSGSRLEQTTSRMRLRGINETTISFEHDADYVNAGCLSDSCKIFAYDGGGLEWETPSTGVNSGEAWGYTGDIAVANIGTGAADLVMFLPNINVDVCHRINVLLSVEAETDTPPTTAIAAGADQFLGTYNAAPTNLTAVAIDGKKSACVQLGSLAGTAVTNTPLASPYIYYQVLIAR